MLYGFHIYIYYNTKFNIVKKNYKIIYEYVK